MPADWHKNLKDRYVNLLEPGQFVRHPTQPDWGLGQVQSVIGPRVTVNFTHAGKLLINTEQVVLDVVLDLGPGHSDL
jgi:hypothetical protein